MAQLIRPLEPDDEAALAPLDAAYAARYGLWPAINRASVSFFARGDHAFVACVGGAPVGFVLAQAVWQGERPLLQISRLAAADDAPAGTREALVAAVTKSAYDAAVYHLQALVPSADREAQMALAAQRYAPQALCVLGRTLGSRGQKEDG